MSLRPAPHLREAWFQYTLAVQTFITALELASNPLAAPFMDPAVEAAILLSLSRTTFEMAYRMDFKPGESPDEKTLLAQAYHYASRGLKGLGFELDGSADFPPQPAGWRNERLARYLILQQLRVCFWARESRQTLAPEIIRRYADDAERLTSRLRQGTTDVQRWLLGNEAGREVSTGERWEWSRFQRGPCCVSGNGEDDSGLGSFSVGHVRLG